MVQQFSSGANIEDPVGNREPQENISYRTGLSLIHKVDYEEKTTTSLKIKPSTSEKTDEPEDEKLQLKTIHQTKPSVMEQSLNNSSYDPSFFRHIYQFN